MGTKEKQNIQEDSSFLLAEYNTLRAEAIKRLELQNQLVAFTIVVFGTLLSVGLQSKNAAITFSYPILALFLSVSWAHFDYRIRQIGHYIRNRIENVAGLENMGWEHYMATDNTRLLYPLSIRGIFNITQLLAIVTGVSVAVINNTFDAVSIISLSFSAISFILTFFVLKKPSIKPIRL